MIRRADSGKGPGAAPMAARSIVMTRGLSCGDGNTKPKRMPLFDRPAPAAVRSIRTGLPANHRIGSAPSLTGAAA
jgi:hypothetical protein